MSDHSKARIIAFYLPQFHPIPENDEWWGKGFTEWTNVAKARPLFRGHHQPNVPTDLGFYDLRLPEARQAQATLAREHGVEGFCYWHYWFGGKRLLEQPFNEVLRSGEPDFPFCLGWANQTWTGIWHGAPKKILIEQTYPGPADYEKHFYSLLEAFQDRRYVRVGGKPLFLIYRPTELPHPVEFIEQWQNLAVQNGLPGIHFVAHLLLTDDFDYRAKGFDAVVPANTFRAANLTCWQRAVRWHHDETGMAEGNSAWRRGKALLTAVHLKGMKHLQPLLKRPKVLDYREAMLYFLEGVGADEHAYPCVVPNWDNSPRSGVRAVVLKNSTPGLFRKHLHDALRLVADRPLENRIVFLKSWNEWAEGNYVEPDLRFGRQYLEAIRDEVVPAIPSAPKLTTPML